MEDSIGLILGGSSVLMAIVMTLVMRHCSAAFDRKYHLDGKSSPIE